MNRIREFRRQLRASVGRALAYQVRDGHGAAISGVLERVIRGHRVHDAELTEVFAYDADEDDEPRPQRVGISAGPQVFPGAGAGKGVALITMRGIALYDLEYQPYCFSTLLFAQTITALGNDPEIGTIIIDVDTPGGAVTGTAEAGDAVFAAREKKKVIALVNPLCASAGYWIASQATQIVAVPSADIGSIGVFMMHADCSVMMEQAGIKPTFIFAGEHKVDGNPYQPLSDDARANWQDEVDTIYAAFLAAVARGRGTTVADVKANFGQGRTLMAPAAKKVGMIDAVSTLDGALARFGVSSRPTSARRRGAEEASGTADEADQGGAEPQHDEPVPGQDPEPDAAAGEAGDSTEPSAQQQKAAQDGERHRKMRHAMLLRRLR